MLCLFRIIMSQPQQSNEQQPQDLEQLRQEVKLTSSKLLDLTYNESQYIDTLEMYNNKAKTLINQDYIEEALIYLAEAERLLEYGASCGKTIERNLIICTLHNQACCYYRAPDLATAARYLEAVIFNLKNHLQSVQPSPTNSSTSEHRRGKKNDQLMMLALQKKIDLVHYYLKYCTVNSQAKNRIFALDAGKRTIQVLKALSVDLKQQKVLQSLPQAEAEDLHTLITDLKMFKQEINIIQFDNYLALARYYLKMWNENKVIKKISYNLEKQVNNYSISQVIQMGPLQYHGDSHQNKVDSRAIMRQIVHFAMGYFTISTQYRLIAENLYHKIDEKVRSQEYLKANISHLMAIIFLAMHINCDLLFMKQIISSYEHHYQINLVQEQLLQSPQLLTQRLLLEPLPQKPKYINTILAAKLRKLKSKSKQKKKVHTEYQDTLMYESKAYYKVNQTKNKGKRSVSKQKNVNKVKKPQKVLNDSLFESSKHLNNSKELKPRSISAAHKQRSVSAAKKIQHHKTTRQKSISKDSQPVKPIKLPIKIIQKAADKNKKLSKKYNDEYQLSNAKCPSKKRSHSISSGDLSCSVRDVNKTKMEGGQKRKKSHKMKRQDSSKQKRLRDRKDSKQAFTKNYYV